MRRGFTLVELLVALLLLEVGLLATTGMILLAQRSLNLAELTVRATLEAEALADSLLVAGSGGGGNLPRSWGELRWGPDPSGGGGLRVLGLSASGADTLTRLTAWPKPGWRPGSRPF